MHRDILINNASAISLTPTEQTEPKRFDLMYDINVRGTFMMSRACIPHLKKGTNAHILNLSPPINMDLKWFAGHLAYTISKYNMTMIALGLSAELKKYHIAANALWPRTTIATAAVNNLLGGEALMKMSRTPEILADAVRRKYWPMQLMQFYQKVQRNVVGMLLLMKRYWQKKASLI